jgi:chromosome segregation ATPase
LRAELQEAAVTAAAAVTKTVTQAATQSSKDDAERAKRAEDAEDWKNEVRVANDQAEDMLLERDEARRKVAVLAASIERHLKGEEAARRENEALKREIKQLKQEKLHLNEEIVMKLSEWESEKEDLKREMEDMKCEIELRGKMLLKEWGKQEVGPPAVGEKQGYKYKYVKES